MKKNTIYFICALMVTLTCTAQNVTTLAGSTQGFVDGAGTSAQFNSPFGIVTDAAGNIYVADTNNHKIRKITSEGVVTTLAGSTQGFAEGQGASAQFNTPIGLAVDVDGNVYVADRFNYKIRKINPNGVVSTFAGSTIGSANGTGTAAQFKAPYGIAFGTTGNLYVADRYNHNIREITPAGVVSTLAGSSFGFADGAGTIAQFNQPLGVATDASGNVYVADLNNHKIRKINPNGMVSTFAGSTGGFVDGAGSTAQFYYPSGVATDAIGNVYVADTSNNKIRKITTAGVVSTLAGSTVGFTDGAGALAQFNFPVAVAIDNTYNVFVADKDNEKIRKITQTLGIAQNELHSKIKIYPNPVTTLLTVEIEKGSVLDKIRITDLSGKIILTQTQYSNAVNVENLAKGTYILEAYSGAYKMVSKLIKE